MGVAEAKNVTNSIEASIAIMQEVAVSNSTDGDGEVRQRRADSQALEVPHAVEVEPERTPDGSKPMAMGKDEAPKSISAGAVGPSGMEEDPQEPEDGFIDLSGDEADANDSMNMTTASPVPKRMTKSARPGALFTWALAATAGNVKTVHDCFKSIRCHVTEVELQGCHGFEHRDCFMAHAGAAPSVAPDDVAETQQCAGGTRSHQAVLQVKTAS